MRLPLAGLRPLIALILALAILSVMGHAKPGPAPVYAAASQTFRYTSSEQTFVVPPGVTRLHVVAVGAPGGTDGSPSRNGGRGARIEADVTVTPGQLLYIEVGGSGIEGGDSGTGQGGFNGGGKGNSNGNFSGGGGGGASDVRTVSCESNCWAGGSAASLISRLVVAAGGGGASGGGTHGGDAGQSGGGGSAVNGSAGTASAGGSGGINHSCSGGGCSDGSPGLLGWGGAGGFGRLSGGGGGGAGLYGGGGGAGGSTASGSLSTPGGGGGGGSSGCPGVTVVPGTCTAPGVDATDPPEVILSYTPTPTLTLASSPNPSQPGQPVTLTATVSGASGTPTGSVTFTSNGQSLGTATLTNGVATLTTSFTAAGTYTLGASYSGDATYAPASATAAQTVLGGAGQQSPPGPQGPQGLPAPLVLPGLSGPPPLQPLAVGCTLVTTPASLAAGTPVTVLLGQVQPRWAVVGIWRVDPTSGRVQGVYFADGRAPVEGTTVGPGERVYLCVTAPATYVIAPL